MCYKNCGNQVLKTCYKHVMFILFKKYFHIFKKEKDNYIICKFIYKYKLKHSAQKKGQT